MTTWHPPPLVSLLAHVVANVCAVIVALYLVTHLPCTLP